MANFIVCPHCEGNGAVLNPEMAGYAYTSDELDELGPDFMEDMMSGVYNVTCPHCRGKRVTTRSEYNRWAKEENDRRNLRLIMLRESGIGPGHKDYY